MSPLLRRIVLFIAAFLLPLQSWAVALAPDCVMTISADAPAHCCKDSHDESHHSQHGSVHASSTDKQSSDKQTTNECLSGADCHCNALYQQVVPFALIAPIKIAADEFVETNIHFVAITHPPLWRPPIAV
jgi:hypothetical protein